MVKIETVKDRLKKMQEQEKEAEEESIEKAEKKAVERTKELLTDRMRFNLDEFELAGVKFKTGEKVIVITRGRSVEPIIGELKAYNPVLGLLTVETENEYRIIRFRDIKEIRKRK